MRRILLVKLSALGDVIQALPVLSALRRRFPDIALDWAVEEEVSEILSGHLYVRRLLIFPRRRILRLLRQGKILEAYGLFRHFVRDLRSETYDAVLDLQGLLKSAVVVALSRSPRKIGFANHREGSTLPLTEKIPPYDPDLHAVRRYLLAAAHLGGISEPVEFPMAPYPDPEEVVRKLGLPSPPWLVFVPLARWETKLWTEKGWKDLSSLAQGLGLPLLWVGGPGDQEYISRIALHGINLAGRLSLKELAGVLSGALAVVSVDTGPMHLAAALGRPVVALFGPTAPWRTGPFGEKHRVLRRSLPCSPCFRKKCPKPICMTGISAQEVFTVLKETARGVSPLSTSKSTEI